MSNPEIETPTVTPEVAKLAGAQMALMLQVRLLDKGVSFEEAAKAAIRSVSCFREAAAGLISHEAFIAIDLGDERGGVVELYSSMEDVLADKDLARHRHVAVQIGQVVAAVLQSAEGKVIDARVVN